MHKQLSRRGLLLGAASLLTSTSHVSAGQLDFTPPEQVFARDHFSEPALSLVSWTLRIEGAVSRPLRLTFSDLLEAPVTRQDAVLECAGNTEHGTGVAMGAWEGVKLSHLLGIAGASREGSVVLEGADEGQLFGGFASAPYTRIVPVRKCWAPESLLAFKLGGRFLQKRNGFPARVLLPGWYGMDSVKWLRRILVLSPRDQVPDLYSQTGMNRLYCRLTSRHAPVPLTSVLVKSVISYPDKDTKLVRGRVPISGYAWTGDGVIKSVQVSIDGGLQWVAAKLQNQPRRFAWVRWVYDWEAVPGEHSLLCRAEDSEGNLQPLTRDAQRRDNYELNWSAPVRCSVA
jgi:DMSO/TMAO reductase YedYZ molybdopterin-dependent catalytic subunit